MRVVILGNGPSQKDLDLDDLKDEAVVFACNRIHLRYDETDWRPTHWVMVERSKNPYWKEDLRFHTEQRYQKLVSKKLYDSVPGATCYFQHPCSENHTFWTPPTEWHDGICTFGGPVFVAIQIAVKEMEADEIVLYGCDSHYRVGEENNMVDGYIPKEGWDADAIKERNHDVGLARRIASIECAFRGVSLYDGSKERRLA